MAEQRILDPHILVRVQVPQHNRSCLEQFPEEAAENFLPLFYFPFPCFMEVMLRISFDKSRRDVKDVRKERFTFPYRIGRAALVEKAARPALGVYADCWGQSAGRHQRKF